MGCRKRGLRSDLLRAVAVEVDGIWSVVPDPRRRRPGRGVWLHLDPDCLQRAQRRTAFTRALHAGGSLDSSPLAAYVAAAERA